MNAPQSGTHQDASAAAGAGSSFQLTLMPASSGEGGSGNFYKRAARTLQREKWIVIGAFLLVLGAVAAFTFLRKPVYQATSVVMIEQPRTSMQVPVGDFFEYDDVSRNVKNEIEIITSRSLAMEVAERLKQAARRTSTPFTVLSAEEGEEQAPSISEVARRLREHYVSVSPAGTDVDVVRIRANSTIPAEAERIASFYAEAYADYNRSNNRSTIAASREFLDEVTSRFSEQLQETENELTTFLNQERIVAPDEEARQLLKQVGELQSQQSQTRLALGMAEAELRDVEQEVNRITPGVAARISSSDDVMVDRIKEQIADLQIEQQEIYARYPELRMQPPKEGRLAEIERELSSLSAQLDQHVERLVEEAVSAAVAPTSPEGRPETTSGRLQAIQDLRRQITQKNIEISGLEARLSSIDGELNMLQSRLAEIPNNALVLQRLQRARQSQEEVYLSLVDKLQEARIAEQAQLGYVNIIDDAYLLEEPIRPRKALNLMLGALLGLLFGIALAFAWRTVDPKIRRSDDLEERGLRVIGVAPRIARDPEGNSPSQTSAALDAVSRPSTAARRYDSHSEGYRRAYASLLLGAPSGNPAILITSAEPEEGKSVTATRLAAVSARSGRRTLLIDGDPHNATTSETFGVASEAGFADLLLGSGAVSLERCVRKTDVENLYVLPAGKEASGAGVAAGSRRADGVLQAIKAEFDMVIIDSPPVLGAADSLFLTALCDAVVVVAYAGRTYARALESAVRAIREMGKSVFGVILNGSEESPTYSLYPHEHERNGHPLSAQRFEGRHETRERDKVAASG